MLAGRAAFRAFAVVGKIRMLVRLDRNVGKRGQRGGVDEAAVLAIERAALAQQTGERCLRAVDRHCDFGECAAVQDQRTGAVTQGEIKSTTIDDDLTGINRPARLRSTRRCLGVVVEGDRACARRHTLDRAAGNGNIDRCVVILVLGRELADLAAADRRRAGDIGLNIQRIDLAAGYRHRAAVKRDRVGDIAASGHRQLARRDARHFIVLVVSRLANPDHVKRLAVQVDRSVGGNVGPVLRSGRAGERNVALQYDRAAGVLICVVHRVDKRAEELLADLRLRGRTAEGTRAVGVQLGVAAEDNIEGVGGNVAQQRVRSDNLAPRENIAAGQQVARLGSGRGADLNISAAGELYRRVTIEDSQAIDCRIAIDFQLARRAEDEDIVKPGAFALKARLAVYVNLPEVRVVVSVNLQASSYVYKNRHFELAAVGADIEAGVILIC